MSKKNRVRFSAEEPERIFLSDDEVARSDRMDLYFLDKLHFQEKIRKIGLILEPFLQKRYNISPTTLTTRKKINGA